MLNFLKTLLALACGVAMGLFLTWLTIERGYGFGAVKAGPWTAWPRSGTAEADPYARAALARNAETPLGLAEGLAFTASEDSAGRQLDAACLYRLSGAVPPARYWTLTLSDARGRLAETAQGRYGFTSAEILRDGDGRFEISVARGVQPGNWLQPGAQKRFLLALRLYDSPVSATASALERAALPVITRGECL